MLEDFREIKEADRIHKQGIFIAEGQKVVEILLRSRFKIRSIVLAENKRDSLNIPPGIDTHILPQAEMDRLVGFPIHRGVLASAERGAPNDPFELASGGRVLLLEGIANHDNVGGLFRAAACFGAAAVLLDPHSADPLYRKAIRTSMGAVLTAPFARFTSWPDPIDRLIERGFVVWALTPSAGAKPLTTLRTPPPKKLALLFGAEGEGLSRAALEKAQERWSIPMAPGADSLNVAVAAAVTLFALASAEY